VTEITEEDNLAMKQSKSSNEVCKYRVSLFSSRAHYVLSAETDFEMQGWIEAFNNLLASRFSPAELEAKRQAALVCTDIARIQKRLGCVRLSWLCAIVLCVRS
jgi:hypothetical protein